MYNGNFSLWCDFIESDFLDGDFKKFIANGDFNGATSNPSIFKNAITTNEKYREASKNLENKTPKQKYEILAMRDIRRAAEIMLRNFCEGDDGFISIEVDPNLMSSKEIYKEGKRLYSAIGMPNVTIKVPATKEGIDAMSDLIEKGINVNATLIFSPEQTKECLSAMKKGTKKFQKRFPNANLPKCVISIFVSRFDKILDAKFEEFGLEKAKFGIYNATLCYEEIQNANLKNVRALFASTGVKNPDLPKDYYIKALMFQNVVNTAPLDAIKAFLQDKGEIIKPAKKDEIQRYFDALKKNNIEISHCYKELLDDGMAQFKVAFDEILQNLKG